MSKRPDVYRSDDGTWTFRASSLGGCLRGLVAARMGIQPQPPKAFLGRALGESSLAEEVVKLELAKQGFKVYGAQDEVFLDYPEGRITGHLDGYVESEKGLEKSLLEIKAFGRSLFQQYVRSGLTGLAPPFAQMYGMQISAYMYATGLPSVVVVYGKEHGMTLTKMYSEPLYKEDDLRTRMAHVHSFADREMYPECDAKCSSSSWYWHIHEEKEKTRVNSDELEEKVEKAARLKDTIEALTTEHRRITDELKGELAQGENLLGPWSANVSRSHQKRTDLDRMRREQGEDFMEQYQFEVPVTRLIIRKKKGD